MTSAEQCRDDGAKARVIVKSGIRSEEMRFRIDFHSWFGLSRTWKEGVLLVHC